MARFSEILALIVLLCGSFSLGTESEIRYPNTTSGLEQMMTDALNKANSGDSASVNEMGRTLVLPEFREWFTAKFGDANCALATLAANDCLGPRMAMAYERTIDSIPVSLALTLHDFHRERMTNFEAVNETVTCARPIKFEFSSSLVGSLSTTPFLSEQLSELARRREPLYSLWAYSNEKQTLIAFFVYEKGAFRFVGMPHPVRTEEWIAHREDRDIPHAKQEPRILTEEQVQVGNAVISPVIAKRTVVVKVELDKDYFGEAPPAAYTAAPATSLK